MATALSSDAQIYYEVHGSGPAVLFVHGSGGHHAAWWQQVAALSPSYSVITVDLRGFGNSRWESAHDARNFPATSSPCSTGCSRLNDVVASFLRDVAAG